MNRVMGSLQRSRNSLGNPKKRTLDELRTNKYAVCTFLYTLSIVSERVVQQLVCYLVGQFFPKYEWNGQLDFLRFGRPDIKLFRSAVND